MPLAGLIHQRLTATVAKGRDDADWAGFAREVSESAGLEPPASLNPGGQGASAGSDP
jgi:hypothetical protein